MMITRICKEAGCTAPRRSKMAQYCEVHRAARHKINSDRANREKLVRSKMAPHEVSASRLTSPVRQASIRGQKEVPALLAVWEAMDALLANPATDSADIELLLESKLPRPISHQAVGQIERRVLLKLRKALGPTYKQVLADGGLPSHGGQYSMAPVKAGHRSLFTPY